MIRLVWGRLDARPRCLKVCPITDWDRIRKETVTALIEVNVTPQSQAGFDRIAERIYQYDEVESMYLMSGSFDLTVTKSGSPIPREMASVISSRISKNFRIPEGLIFCIFWFEEMTDAISLGIGEPDFVTPWHIRDAGIYSLERGHTKYTSNAGMLQLRREITPFPPGPGGGTPDASLCTFSG